MERTHEQTSLGEWLSENYVNWYVWYLDIGK